MKGLLIVLLAASGQLFAGDSARDWLDDMSTALQTLDYDGTFVYLHDNKLETMRIIHRMDAGGQRERLVVVLNAGRRAAEVPLAALDGLAPEARCVFATEAAGDPGGAGRPEGDVLRVPAHGGRVYLR